MVMMVTMVTSVTSVTMVTMLTMVTVTILNIVTVVMVVTVVSDTYLDHVPQLLDALELVLLELAVLGEALDHLEGEAVRMRRT